MFYVVYGRYPTYPGLVSFPTEDEANKFISKNGGSLYKDKESAWEAYDNLSYEIDHGLYDED